MRTLPMGVGLILWQCLALVAQAGKLVPGPCAAAKKAVLASWPHQRALNATGAPQSLFQMKIDIMTHN